METVKHVELYQMSPLETDLFALVFEKMVEILSNRTLQKLLPSNSQKVNLLQNCIQMDTFAYVFN